MDSLEKKVAIFFVVSFFGIILAGNLAKIITITVRPECGFSVSVSTSGWKPVEEGC